MLPHPSRPERQASGRSQRAPRSTEPKLSPEAERLYREVLTLAARGQREEARARYAQANALHAITQRNSALRLRAQGRLEEAAACYRKVVSLQPDFAPAHQELGDILSELGEVEEAAHCYRDAQARAPDLRGLLAQALAHHQSGRLEAAEMLYRQLLELDADQAEVLHLFGVLANQTGRAEQAVGLFRRAITVDPADASYHYNLGNALAALEQHAAAIASYREAVTLRPELVEAIYKLAEALVHDGQHEAAVPWFRRALELRPDHHEAQIGLDLALAALAAQPAEHGFGQLQWRGEAAPGQTLLIHHDGGPDGNIGEAIRLCRFATRAAERGLLVCIEAEPKLVSLMQSLAGVAQVVARGAPRPEFDLHCPLPDLPAACAAMGETTPPTLPYLQAEPARVAAWAERLPAGTHRRIGLAWSGEAHPQGGASVSPLLLAPLFEAPLTSFFSLQDTEDLAELAGMIANLELVIAVDGALVHLAGALGKPVWLLAHTESAWPDDRRHSPWYPLMRIYRQPTPGAWLPVIAAVAADLQAEAG